LEGGVCGRVALAKTDVNHVAAEPVCQFYVAEARGRSRSAAVIDVVEK
jgi:hypothetical protein